MNCKPGDLAICVGADQARLHRIGCIVRVIAPWLGQSKGDWVIEYQGKEYRAMDCNLRPLRDPGDDAVDESTRWLPPIPLTEEEKA